MTIKMNQSQKQEKSKGDVSRRDFLQIAWIATAGLTTAAVGGMTLQFLSPRIVEGEFGGVFNLGAIDEFPVGSVTPITKGRFYLVRQDDGGLLALYQKCTHLGCAVPWNPEGGQFICPCHASAFEMDGQVINAPAPRPLDRFPITFEEGNILVDTGMTIQRDKASREDAVYPDDLVHHMEVQS